MMSNCEFIWVMTLVSIAFLMTGGLVGWLIGSDRRKR